MDIEIAAQAIGELTHLAPAGVGIALCGLAGMKVAKKLFWMGQMDQVACSKCKEEHARRRDKARERRCKHG